MEKELSLRRNVTELTKKLLIPIKEAAAGPHILMNSVHTLTPHSFDTGIKYCVSVR
jgi:hypothetical protein